MRIIIDTDLKEIIVPNKYFENIDKMNEIVKKAKSENTFDYIDYIKGEFEIAIAKPLKRTSDVTPSRSRTTKKDK